LSKVEDFYVLVSDAYVEGLMYGEAIDTMVEGDLVLETIQIP
jgi:sRNA-binding regulator protein Hfq